MRISAKGRVTIPADIREKAGLFPNTDVEFIFDGKAVRIQRAKSAEHSSRGESVVRQLRGRGTVRMTTDEIMSLMRGT
jgi:AbrB family looped-hinge helix DNA binding protein